MYGLRVALFDYESGLIYAMPEAIAITMPLVYFVFLLYICCTNCSLTLMLSQLHQCPYAVIHLHWHFHSLTS
jgi:hypothetical protein